MSTHVPLMIGTVMSRNSRIFASRAIPLPVSRLVIVETYHRSYLTGIPALTSALIVVALY